MALYILLHTYAGRAYIDRNAQYPLRSTCTFYFKSQKPNIALFRLATLTYLYICKCHNLYRPRWN